MSNGEDPHSADGDGDGLLDGEEIELGTMTGYYDSDYDGLWDGAELDDYNTDPLDADSDDDGIEDGDEVDAGTDPNNADSDGDGYADGVDGYPLIAAGEIEVTFSDEDVDTTSFGGVIAIDGDVAVVGAARQDTTTIWTNDNLGIVYVYRWDGTLWNLEAELTPPDETSSQVANDFGNVVAIDGNVIVVGAPGAHDYGRSLNAVGSAYVFRYDEASSSWAPEAKLTPTTTYYNWNETTSGWAGEIYSGLAMCGQENENFGDTVALDGDVITIGAPGFNTQVGCTNRSAATIGAVYVFRYDEASSWDVDKLALI